MHPVLFNFCTSIWERLNRRALNESQLLLDNMVNRSIIVHTIYGNFVKQISQLSNFHIPPSAMNSRPCNLPRPLYRAPRQRFSAVASDRRARPPTTPMRVIFGVQSAAAPPTAGAFQVYTSSKGKRKRSFADRVNALVNAVQNEFSYGDSKDSSSATSSDNAQPNDVPHHENDEDCDTQETDDDPCAFANEPALRPGKFGTPFIDGSSSRTRSRPKSFPATQLTLALGRKLAAPKETTRPSTTTSNPPVPALAIHVPATATNTPPTQDILPTQDTSPDVVRRALMKKQVCFYYAHGLSRPHNPCKYLHGIMALSPPTPYALPSLPFSIPKKPMDTNTTMARNEGALQEYLRSWGILIPFPSTFSITVFINREWGGMTVESHIYRYTKNFNQQTKAPIRCPR